MNRGNYIFFFFALSVALVLSQCKQYVEECEECKDFVFSDNGGAIIPSIVHAQNENYAPCFNPNNGNEFVYVRKQGTASSLVKYNLVTKQSTILLPNQKIVGRPIWGKNGKVVFSGNDLQIYVVDETGTNLTKLTTVYLNNYPSFIDSTRIFINAGASQPSETGNKIIDINGNRLDSIFAEDYGGTIWMNAASSTGMIAGDLHVASGYYLITFNPSNKSHEIIQQRTDISNGKMTGITWHPNSADILFSMYNTGLFSVNKTTKKIIKIKDGCQTKTYRHISISPNGKRIVVERVNSFVMDKIGNIFEQASIYIMDINGRNEQLLL